ncbi:uncharacterized protein LOC109074518 [Cyprinus carpio]|uniref:Uncharacterized protein LOC109074518 n=1 Tax=Cyprinus carpio TaxID=7962 RepID=A0A9R0AN36_CYPCA|nr:uncharacterized protein LOC109074518 [Cyprinus carpio]
MKNILLYFLISLSTEGVFGESLSVKEGDSVTLFPQLTEIKKDDVIDWRFGDILIARVRNNNKPSVYEDALDGKFKGRLKLDGQTGDLTITNFRNTDTGEYEVSNIINNFRKTISVTVMSAVEVKLVSVLKGDSVTLHTDLTEVHEDDVIQWRHGDTCVAEINKTCDGPDGRFRDRLKLDHQTGSLNITNITTADSGLYEVKISSSRRTINQRFSVTVIVGFMFMREGSTVILNTDTEIQRDDEILWKFGDEVIRIDRFNRRVDSRWRNISVSDNGDLILANIQSDQFGDYDVEIKNKSALKKLQYKVKDVKDYVLH